MKFSAGVCLYFRAYTVSAEEIQYKKKKESWLQCTVQMYIIISTNKLQEWKYVFNLFLMEYLDCCKTIFKASSEKINEYSKVHMYFYQCYS